MSKENNEIFVRIIGFISYTAITIGVVCYLLYWALNLDEHTDQNFSRSVEKCLNAIENRNWDDYRATIEPSAIVEPNSPCTFVHFKDINVSLLSKNNKTATVKLVTKVVYDKDNSSYPYTVNLELVKVHKPNWQGSIGIEGWYLTNSDRWQLPFCFGGL